MDWQVQHLKWLIIFHLCSFQDGQCIIYEVEMAMVGSQRRFGFSLMGGAEEGFPARVDEITPGKLLENIILKHLTSHLPLKLPSLFTA